MPVYESDSLQVTTRLIRDTFFDNTGNVMTDGLVCEILTLGFVAAKHPLLGVAFKRVINGQVANDKVIVVNWFGESHSDYCELFKVESRLDEQLTAYAQENRPHGWSLKRIQSEGVSAQMAADSINDYLSGEATLTPDTTLVGHGLAMFSLPFYFRFMSSHPGKDAFAPSLASLPLLDTGCLYKACLNRTLIQEGETFAAYANRIAAVKGTGKWNMFTASKSLGIDWPTNQDALLGGTAVALEIYKHYEAL